MDNLTIGQRIDVLNTLPGNDYHIKPKTYIGRISSVGYGHCFFIVDQCGNPWEQLCHEPKEFKKVGTFIIKEVHP